MTTLEDIQSTPWEQLAREAQQIEDEAGWMSFFVQLKEVLEEIQRKERKNREIRFDLMRLRDRLSPLYEELAASPFADISRMRLDQPEVVSGLARNPMVSLWIETDPKFMYNLWLVMQSFLLKNMTSLGKTLENRVSLSSAENTIIDHGLQDWFLFHFVGPRTEKSIHKLMDMAGNRINAKMEAEMDLVKRCMLAHRVVKEIYAAFDQSFPVSPMSFLESA